MYFESYSQTCCTAGAPLSTYISPQTEAPGVFSLQLTYEYKSINALVLNDTRFQNDPRSRFGQNLVLKADYVLNKKWAFSLLIPGVHQSRQTISEKESSFGIGDLSTFVQRSFSGLDQNLFVAMGLKLPTGITRHRSDSGVFLSPDMQSGSGTLDYIFSVGYQKTNFLKSGLSLDVNSYFKYNTTNESFGSSLNFNGRSFAFGNELINQVNLNYLFVKSAGFVIPDIGVKYRITSSNEEQGTIAPNSGGRWWSIPFGISLVPNESSAYRIFAEVPIYQKLDGFQITSDFSVGITFKKTLNKKEPNIDISF